MGAVSERVVNLIARLEPEQDMNSALEQLLENELLRRLNRYQFTERTLSRKYGMSFAEFKARRVVERQGFRLRSNRTFGIGKWRWME